MERGLQLENMQHTMDSENATGRSLVETIHVGEQQHNRQWFQSSWDNTYSGIMTEQFVGQVSKLSS